MRSRGRKGGERELDRGGGVEGEESGLEDRGTEPD